MTGAGPLPMSNMNSSVLSISRYEIWFNASSALIYQYLPHRWDDFAIPYPYIKDILECNNTNASRSGKAF